MSDEDIVRVTCDIVVEKGSMVLMGKRGNIFGKGSWALPGGHLEINEKTVECVTRELNEEVGITPIKMELLGVLNDIRNIPGQERHYVRFVYLVTKFSGEVTNKEPDKCEAWEWFDKNKLPEPVFVGHVKVIEFYLNKKDKFFQE